MSKQESAGTDAAAVATRRRFLRRAAVVGLGGTAAMLIPAVVAGFGGSGTAVPARAGTGAALRVDGPAIFSSPPRS